MMSTRYGMGYARPNGQRSTYELYFDEEAQLVTIGHYLPHSLYGPREALKAAINPRELEESRLTFSIDEWSDFWDWLRLIVSSGQSPLTWNMLWAGDNWRGYPEALKRLKEPYEKNAGLWITRREGRIAIFPNGWGTKTAADFDPDGYIGVDRYLIESLAEPPKEGDKIHFGSFHLELISPPVDDFDRVWYARVIPKQTYGHTFSAPEPPK